jgi:hypothetical protein
MNLTEACKTDDFNIILNVLNEKIKPTKECYKILLENYRNKKKKLFYNKDGMESPNRSYRWINGKM